MLAEGVLLRAHPCALHFLIFWCVWILYTWVQKDEGSYWHSILKLWLYSKGMQCIMGITMHISIGLPIKASLAGTLWIHCRLCTYAQAYCRCERKKLQTRGLFSSTSTAAPEAQQGGAWQRRRVWSRNVWRGHYRSAYKWSSCGLCVNKAHIFFSNLGRTWKQHLQKGSFSIHTCAQTYVAVVLLYRAPHAWKKIESKTNTSRVKRHWWFSSMRGTSK